MRQRKRWEKCNQPCAMFAKTNVRLIVFLIGSIGVFAVFYSSQSEKQVIGLSHILQLPTIVMNDVYDGGLRAGYAISTPKCKMLNPNPWNESIQKYLKEPRPLICSRLPLLTYVEQQEDLSNVLKINQKVINKYKPKGNGQIKCCYEVITRISQSIKDYNTSADSLYELSNCTNFTEQVQLTNDAEFILVNCQRNQKGEKQATTVYRNVHAVIPVLPEAEEKVKKFLERKKAKLDHEDILNVVILGIDSVSKLNLRRVMPRTLKFLQESNWVELNGYNKVGENTFPNLMAILSGESMRNLEETCWANRSHKMDDCPSIWKEFNDKGYVTLYAEDTPAISTFNLLRTGFVEKPTDYYMRPFMLAAHQLLQTKALNGLPVCLGPVLIVDHVLDYAKRFLRAFNNYNYFGLLWLNSLSHNDVNVPKALDVSVHRFLTELSKIGAYDNTLFLLLSDHGVRFGNIRETFLGFLEERLPFLFVWCPKWFREKYPEKYNSLLINQNRLTSPYDVYVTVKNLLTDKEKRQERASTACPKCSGLLEVQSLERTCADASIDVNWCLCSEFRSVPVQDVAAKLIGKYLYESIMNRTNELIKQENITKSLCLKWKYERVLRMDEIVLPDAPHHYSLRNISNAEVERYEDQTVDPDTKIFVIIIVLSPGKTKFESTVRMQLHGNRVPDFALLEPPKRLDGIYKTSKCVDNLLLKPYCYCKRR